MFSLSFLAKALPGIFDLFKFFFHVSLLLVKLICLGFISVSVLRSTMQRVHQFHRKCFVVVSLDNSGVNAAFNLSLSQGRCSIENFNCSFFAEIIDALLCALLFERDG